MRDLLDLYVQLSKDDRQKLDRETRKEINSEIADTEAYIGDAIERMEDEAAP